MNQTKKLYSNLKTLKFTEHLNALESGKLLAPVHIRIKPINACNHDCWYCAYHVDWLDLGKLMEYKDAIPKQKMIEIIDDMISMGVKAVTFSGGGEPLMYPHIAECVEKLSTGGVKVAALTNGSFLKGAVADAFANYASWVRISIDAWDGPSYVKSRNVKENEFDKVIENIANFAQRKSACVIGISYIIEDKNCEHLYDFAALMKKVGVNHISFSGCVVSNSGKENNKYHEKIKKEVRKQISRALLLENADFQIIDNYHDLDERFDKAYEMCPFMRFQVVVGADCKIYTCHDKAYTDEGLLGSIEDKSFKDLWFSEETWGKMEALNPSIHCNHHCVADKKNKMILGYLNIDKRHADFV